jgi:hypothetical protein
MPFRHPKASGLWTNRVKRQSPSTLAELYHHKFFSWGIGIDVPPSYADRYVYHGTTIVRAEFGGAMGGLRSPYVGVPISTYRMPTGGVCQFIGNRTPCSTELIAGLYKSHGDYVSQVDPREQDQN